MIPIQDLLARIRWDPAFAQARFELGYYDRLEQRLIVVPFAQVHFPADAPRIFELIDDQGRLHTIPFHRVKSVFRNGERIWHREH